MTNKVLDYYRLAPPQATVAGVRAIDTTSYISTGVLISCVETETAYLWDQASTNPDDNGVTTIAPTTGSGRWKNINHISDTSILGVEITGSRSLASTDIGKILFNQSSNNYGITFPDNTDLNTMKVGESVRLTNIDFNGIIDIIFPDGVGYNGNTPVGIGGFELKNVGASTLIVRVSPTNYIASTQLPYDNTTNVFGTGDHTDFCAQVQSIAPSSLHRRQNGVSANRSLVQDDLGVLLHANGANYTLSLPTVGDATLNNGASFYVCQRDTSALTVQAPVGVTLNGIDNGSITTSGPLAYGVFFRQGPLAQNAWLYFDLTTIGILPQTPNAILFNDGSGNTTDSAQLTTNTTVEVSGVPTLQKIKMTSDDAFAGFSSLTYNDSPAAINHFIRGRGRGTESAPQALQAQDNVAFDIAAGMVDDGGTKKFLIGGTRVFRTDETPTSTACPMSYVVNVSNDDSGDFSTFSMFSRGSMKLVGSGTGQLDLQFSDFVNIIDGDLKFNNQLFFDSVGKQVLANVYTANTSDTTILIDGQTQAPQILTTTNNINGGAVIALFNDDGNERPEITFVNGRGSYESKNSSQIGDVVGSIKFAGTTQTNLFHNTTAFITAITKGTITNTDVPVGLQIISSSNDNGTISLLELNPDGSMSLKGLNGSSRNLELNFPDEIDIITNNLLLNGSPFPLHPSTYFAQTTNSPVVTNTATEGSIQGVGTGAISFTANELQVGDSFQLTIGLAFGASGTESIQIRLLDGATEFFTTGLLGPINTSGIKDVVFNVTSTVTAVGVSGTIQSVISVLRPDIIFISDERVRINSTTVDTTGALTFDLKAKWSGTGAANSIQSKIITFKKLN